MDNIPAVQNNDVAIIDGKLQPATMGQAQMMASAIFDSGLAPKAFDSPQKIFIAICYGSEMGLSAMQSVQSIAVINGKPTIYGDSQLAVCSAHPDFEDIKEWLDGETAFCEVKRKDRTPTKRAFSKGDAEKARLWGKAGPWSLYPMRMLQMRARSWALRDSFSDALRGMPQMEEMRDIAVSEQPEIVVSQEEHEEVPEKIEQAQPIKNTPGTMSREHAEILWNMAMSHYGSEEKATEAGMWLAMTINSSFKSIMECPDAEFPLLKARLQKQINKDNGMEV